MTHSIKYGYTDIDIELKKQKDGDVALLTDADAIKANIMNVVKTLQGTRRMNPDFAYGPWNLLFRPITDSTAREIGEVLQNTILSYEDRINLTNININTNTRLHTYNITISYTLKDIGSPYDEMKLNFILQQL